MKGKVASDGGQSWGGVLCKGGPGGLVGTSLENSMDRDTSGRWREGAVTPSLVLVGLHVGTLQFKRSV